jgi:hypothetical protein
LSECRGDGLDAEPFRKFGLANGEGEKLAEKRRARGVKIFEKLVGSLWVEKNNFEITCTSFGQCKVLYLGSDICGLLFASNLLICGAELYRFKFGLS